METKKERKENKNLQSTFLVRSSKSSRRSLYFHRKEIKKIVESFECISERYGFDTAIIGTYAPTYDSNKVVNEKLH